MMCQSVCLGRRDTAPVIGVMPIAITAYQHATEVCLGAFGDAKCPKYCCGWYFWP